MSIHLSARRGEFAVLSVQQISGVDCDVLRNLLIPCYTRHVS